MGTYDTISVGSREYQTKALGKSLRHLKIGDHVRVAYVSSTQEEYEMNPTHRYDLLPARYAVEAVLAADDTIELMTGEPGENPNHGSDAVYLLVVNGRLAGLIDDPAGLAVFDYRGRSPGYTPTLSATEWRRPRRPRKDTQ